MKKLLIILLLGCAPCFGQSDKSGSDFNETSKFHKNALYFNAGTAVLWHQAGASYEHIINPRIFDRNIMWTVKGSLGAYMWWDWSFDYGGVYSNVQTCLIFGKKNHHFEVGAGAGYIFGGDIGGVPFATTLAYRYQKPGGKGIFRAGLSFPEGFFIGGGFSF